MSEERDLDLNEEGAIRMEDSREDHWKYFAQYGKDKSSINALRWYVYTK